MLTMLASTSFIISLTAAYLNSPLPLALTVVSQAAVSSVILFYMQKNSWFSYLLIMVFISGMMVVFAYVASLAPNELSVTSTPLMASLMLMTLPLIYMVKQKEMMNSLNTEINSLDEISQTTPWLVHKMFSNNLSTLTSFMMIYLLIALLVTMKIVNMKKGPLRDLN